LINAFIPPYQPKNAPGDYDPYRSRKLLLHKAEIASLIGQTKQKGLTLVPIKAYTRKGRIKLEFALAKGKKKFDKRDKIAERETKRKIERAMKEEY
jgi:SsrA-binding protein